MTQFQPLVPLIGIVALAITAIRRRAAKKNKQSGAKNRATETKN